MTKKFSIKKLVAGALALAMVVTALPVSGLTAKADTTSAKKVYRSYNPNNGEHLYTTEESEHKYVVSLGYSDEGAAWLAPATSETEVYRAYDPNSGEHLLVPKSEAEGLAALHGWKNEGFKMYSADNKGVPVYRVYNPFATNAGRHHYTSNKAEAAQLVALGWQWDNNGEPVLYGTADGELELTKVESAGRIASTLTSNGGVNILVGYFSTAMSDIVPTDVEIRNVADNTLFTVEKVTMSSDKTSATFALTGTAAAAANTDYLQPLTTYKMIVKSNGKTLEKEFTIPAVMGNASVVEIDATNKRIGVVTLDNDSNYQGNLNVPDSFNVDFEDILGKTVSLEFDKTSTITKLNYLDDKIVVGAFKLSKDDQTLTDLATDKKYKLRVASGTVDDTQLIERAAKGEVGAFNDWAIAADGYVAYGKLTVNAANVVKVAQIEDTFDGGFIKVATTANDVVLNGKTQVNLKDFVIVKDGKTVEVKDLKAGDVVAYSNADSFAEVLPAANTTTGALTAVHDNSITYGGKEYKMSGNDKANIEFQAKYSKKDAVEGKVDNDYLDALAAAKKDVTVTLNRAGQVVYLEGEQAAANTKTKVIVLTDDTKAYEQSLVKYLRFKGSDGSEEKTYDVDISKVKKMVSPAGTTYESGVNGVEGFDFGVVAGSDGKNSTIKTTGVLTNVLSDVAWGTDSATKIADIAPVAGEIVALTFDDKDVCTGVALVSAATGNGTIGAGVGPGVDFSKDGSGVAEDFKAGYSTLNGWQVSKSTPVFIYDDTASTPSVSVTVYGSMSGEVAADAGGNSQKICVYTADKKTVSAVVVLKSAFGLASDLDVKEGVVSTISYSTGAKVDGLTILCGTEFITATDFASIKKADANFKTGDIVTASFKKGTTRLEALGAATEFDDPGVTTATTYGILSLVDAAENKFLMDDGTDGYVYSVATTDQITPTIAKISADGKSVEVATMADIIKASESNRISLSTVKGATGTELPVDSIIVNGTELNKAALKASAEANILAASGAFIALDGTAAKWTEYKNLEAAADRSIKLYVNHDTGNAENDLAGYASYDADKALVSDTAIANVKKAVSGISTTTDRANAGAITTAINTAVGPAPNVVLKSADISIASQGTTNGTVGVTFKYVDGTTSTMKLKNTANNCALGTVY